MKKGQLLIYILQFFCFSLNGQISFDSVKTNQVAGFCHVWGFLKYYHPTIQKGKVDWDSTFIEYLPKIYLAKSNVDYNRTINELVNSLGKVEKLNKPFKYLPNDTSYNNIDFKWFNSSNLFDQANKELLKEIIENYVPRWNVYFKREFNKYYQDKGMNKYYQKNETFPDEFHSLLALSRYWNAIEYFYAYRKIMYKNWNDVLVEYIPKIREASNSSKVYSAFAELTTVLKDCHAYYDNYTFNHEAGFMKSMIDSRKVPILVKFIDGKTVISRIRSAVATETKLKPGDIILAINGIPINEIRKELRRYCGCSTDASVEREVNEAIFKSYFAPEKKNLSITIQDSTGSIRTATFMNDKKGEWLYTPGDSFVNFKKGSRSVANGDSSVRFIANKIGYINLSYINSSKSIRKGFKKLRHSDAIIFDLRNNAATYLIPIGQKLPGKTGNTYANFYHINAKYPGTFKFYKIKKAPWGIRFLHKKFKGKIIFLVNENVQSTYEYQLMALKANFNITLIGSNTAGTDGEASSFLVDENFLTYFTVDAVFNPDGSPTQRVGIKPDISSSQTIQDYLREIDSVLSRAIEFAKTGK